MRNGVGASCKTNPATIELLSTSSALREKHLHIEMICKKVISILEDWPNVNDVRTSLNQEETEKRNDLIIIVNINDQI